MSCRSSRTVTQQTYSEAVHDTVIETVTLTLYDTIRETTTILIQTNNDGDTTRFTTTTDREKIKTTDRTATTLNHQTTQTTTNNTKETTSPIQPISPKFPIRPIIIAFLSGAILAATIFFLRRK